MSLSIIKTLYIYIYIYILLGNYYTERITSPVAKPCSFTKRNLVRIPLGTFLIFFSNICIFILKPHEPAGPVFKTMIERGTCEGQNFFPLRPIVMPNQIFYYLFS
jgi:hypothetical protein